MKKEEDGEILERLGNEMRERKYWEDENERLQIV